jgi:hypothetical protein
MATTGPSLDPNALKMLYNDVLYSIDKQVKPPSSGGGLMQ